jgi:aminomethyltransferase
VSPLKEALAAAGATFRTRYGVEVPASFSGRVRERQIVRNQAGLTDFSWVRVISVPEEKGIDFLDNLVAGNVPKIRFGRMLHTFLGNEAGMVAGDCYVANNDQELILFCENIIPDSQLDTMLEKAGAGEAGARELSGNHALLSLDGFEVWRVVKKLFGPDVLGLPYLSIENYAFEGHPVRLMRAGKTSEFGYLLLVPEAGALALFHACKNGVEELGGGLCGVDAHDDLRLEGRFFNVHAEGVQVRDPLVIGLQWMIDVEKTNYPGAAAIRTRRAEGVRRKLIGLAAPADCEGWEAGAKIFLGKTEVSEVVTACFSEALRHPIGLGVFPTELAYSGLSFRVGNPEGPEVRTISMPPIMPKSLTVKLDEM